MSDGPVRVDRLGAPLGATIAEEWGIFEKATAVSEFPEAYQRVARASFFAGAASALSLAMAGSGGDGVPLEVVSRLADELWGRKPDA